MHSKFRVGVVDRKINEMVVLKCPLAKILSFFYSENSPVLIKWVVRPLVDDFRR